MTKDRLSLNMRALVCLSLAYVSLLPQFYLIFNDQNRPYLVWNSTYHAGILGAVFLLALIYLLLSLVVSRVLRRWRIWPQFLGAAAMMFLLSRTIIAMADRVGIVPSSMDVLMNEMWAKLLYYFLLAVAIPAVWPRQTVRALVNMCLVIFPAVILLIVVPLTWRSYGRGDMRGLKDLVHEGDLWSHGHSGTTTNVLIFILDEWSYYRAFGAGSRPDTMPYTRNLMEQSLVFTQAYSPGSATHISISRMLFPNHPGVKGKSHKDIWHVGFGGIISAEEGSIFDLADPDALKVLSGFYLEYDKLFGGHVDYIPSYKDTAAYERNVPDEIKKLLLTQMSWLRYAGIRIAKKETVDWHFAQVMVHRDAMFAIQSLRRPMMGVFHYCLPHGPYGWRGGDTREWLEHPSYENTVPGYMGNLAFLDDKIAELMAALAERPQDVTLLIFTSDHSWKMDPDHITWDNVSQYPFDIIEADKYSVFKHVPLIVHSSRPGDRGVVNEYFDVGDIHMLIQRFLAGESLLERDE